MNRLTNKIAIITGASRGIGFAVARAFLGEGATVALCGSKLESAQKAVNSLKEEFPAANLLPYGVDVTDTAAVNDLIAKVTADFGRIDILVNNAGVTSAKAITDMTDEDFESVLAINLSAPFKCIRAVAPQMMKTGGSIINTSSMVGTYGGKNQTAYAASKFGVNGLTKSCAKELGGYNIRVNAVAPGVVSTDMVQQSVNPQMQQALTQMTPLARMATPAELAMLYVYLASDESSFTTGAILAVDGGLVL